MKGKNSQDPRMRHLDVKTAGAASATDFTGLIPANPSQPAGPYEDIKPLGGQPAKSKQRFT